MDMDDTKGGKSQHMFAKARILTSGDARFNSVAGNMSIYENCTFPREPQADDDSEQKQFERICNWLTDISFDSIYSESLAKGTEGTGMWFIKTEEFCRWMEDDLQILWGTGKPGAGKTILSSIVINYLLENLDRRHPMPVVFSFCRYSEKYSANQIFSSWVKQLLLQQKQANVDPVRPYFLSHEKDDARPTNKQLLHIISSITSIFERVFIVLDGLDEAEESDRQQLLDGVNSLPSNVHSLIMSRPLMSCAYLVPDAAFLDFEACNEDIERFVEQRINEIPTLRPVIRGKDAAKEQLCAAIKQKSNGMFLVARLQVEALKDCINVHSLMSTLEELPTGVNDLYLHTLDRIESQGSQKAMLAKRTFLWVAYASETLKIQQLQEALAVSLDLEIFDEDSVVTEELIHDMCCGLIFLDFTRSVRFIHYTTLDFLKDRCLSWFQNPHATLACSCVIYLSSLPPAFLQLATYAEGHWGRHARLAYEQGSELPRHVSEFLLKNPIHNWPSLNGTPYASGLLLPEQISSAHLAAFLGLTSYLLEHVVLSTITEINQLTFLHTAAMGGHVSTAEAIMQKWPTLSPHDLSSEGKTPFMLASGCGQTSMMESFLSSSSKDHLIKSRARCGCTALTCAVRQYQTLSIQTLVSLPGVDINATGCDGGLTPLAWAARTGAIPIVNQLLSNPDLDINARNSWTGYTALFEACDQDDINIVKLLLSHPEIDVNLGPNCGCTPLIRSTYSSWRCKAVIPLLLSHRDINLHARCQSSGPALAPCDEWSPEWVSELILTHPRLFANASEADMQFCLERAAELGLESTVKSILSNYLVPANLRPAPPVLIEAAKANQLPIIQTLLGYADINAEDEYGRTALAEAAMRGHLAIVTLLVSREDILVNKGSHPPLIEASRRGYAAIVQLLLGHQATDVNVQDIDGHVSLAWAVDGEHWNVAEMLLAMPTIDVNRGACPTLVKACSKGHEALVRELLGREDIDVNIEDAKGWSPIACAAFIGHESICKILLGRPELKLTGGSVSPFVQAAASGSEAIVRLFLSKGSRCNPNDINGGHTALSIAAFHGFSDIVELLLSIPEVDANLGSPTPLMQACIRGHPEIVTLLLSCSGKDLEVNVQDKGHQYHPTSLWYACYCRRGCLETVRLLLECSDLDVNIGLTLTDPLDPSNAAGSSNSFHFSESDPLSYRDYPDLDEAWTLSTPLHAACIRRPGAVSLLLASPKIDVTRLNRDGKAALELLLKRDPTSENVDQLLSHPDALQDPIGHNVLITTASMYGQEEVSLNIMKKILLVPGQMTNVNRLQPDSGLTLLSAACSIGRNTQVVEHLLSLATIDPNCGSPPPIIKATTSIFHMPDVLPMLLHHPKTDPNIESERGWTALGEACANPFVETSLAVIQSFVSWSGVNVNAGKHSPLAIAVCNGSTSTVQLLLQHPDIDVNCRVQGLRFMATSLGHPKWKEIPSPSQCNIRRGVLFSPLFHGSCVKMGTRRKPYDTKMVTHDPFSGSVEVESTFQHLAISETVDISNTILVHCIKFRHQQIAEDLLLRGDLNVNATGHCGCTALIWASHLCNETIVDRLLSREDTVLDVRCSNHGCTALLAAAHRMKFQVVLKLLSHPRSSEIDTNAFAACGCNVLVCASRSGDEDTVHSILPFVNWRGYPNAQDCEFGRTPLLWASNFGQDSLVQLFLSQPDVSVHHRDKKGDTALILAVRGGHDDVVKTLLASSKVNDLDSCDSNGDTALSLADWYGHKNISLLLRTWGALDIKKHKGVSSEQQESSQSNPKKSVASCQTVQSSVSSQEFAPHSSRFSSWTVFMITFLALSLSLTFFLLPDIAFRFLSFRSWKST